MVKIKKRAIWGYSFESVEKLALEIQSNHKATCVILQEELEQLKQEHAVWREKQELLQISNQESEQDQEMAKQLLDAHYDATVKVNEAKQQLLRLTDDLVKIKDTALDRREKLMSQMNANLKKFLEHSTEAVGERREERDG
jgi:hypothetical protein